MSLVPEHVDIVAYHGSCPDGWCAAFIAKKKYPNAELVPVSYGEPVDLARFGGQHVLVVDFSWPRSVTEAIRVAAKSLTIYDHHKTAQKELEGLDYAVFDMNRSGAGITWDMLNGSLSRPWYVRYVEDRDLWNWKLNSSREISGYLMALPMTIEAWDKLAFISPKQAVVAGEAIRLHIEHYVEGVVKNRVVSRFLNYTIALVNAPYLNISDVCEKLLDYADIGAGWFQRTDGLIQFSLRSRGDLDVSAIAKDFGGGGHKNAAGFQLPTREGRELVDSLMPHEATQSV